MRMRGKYKRPKYVLICRYCDENFVSAHDWARYCSDAHRQADYRKRKEEQAREREEKCRK
jgi:hypothetical protein